jgi:hypothetical protein
MTIIIETVYTIPVFIIAIRFSVKEFHLFVFFIFHIFKELYINYNSPIIMANAVLTSFPQLSVRHEKVVYYNDCAERLNGLLNEIPY